MSRKPSLDDFLAEENALNDIDNTQEGDNDIDVALLSREATTREAEEEYKYVPPAHLPEIKVEPGYVARWVRVSMLGQSDPNNFAARNHEGWEPISPRENPDLARQCGFHKSNDSTSDLIEIGGLVACKMLEYKARARQEYYENLSRNAFNEQVVGDMKTNSNSKIRFTVDERNFKSSRSLDG